MGCESTGEGTGFTVTPGMVVASHCTACGAAAHPPRDFCPECMSAAVERGEVDGRGTIYSFTEVHLGVSEAFRDKVPYQVALVDTRSGLRILTNIVGDTDGLEIGQEVTPSYERDDTGRELLLYRREQS